MRNATWRGGRAERPEVTRIVIHAGFHKTGTSTVQATLRANRAVLKARARLVLGRGMAPLLSAARGYSTWRDPLSLAKVAARADALMADLPDPGQRTLILSAEELSGHMPGREGIDSYAAAGPLLGEVVRALRARFQDAAIAVVFTTRAAESWLRSAHWEHVKSSAMTEDFDSFAARMAGAADLGAEVARLAPQLAPVPVQSIALEGWATDPLGPTRPLLRLARVPARLIEAMTPVPRANAARPEALEALLEINRSISDPEARRAAKRACLARTGQDI